MPRDMFGDVVEPSIKIGSKKWYTVPLSIATHTVIIGAVIIIPLMAADVLPTPPAMMAFVAAPPPPPPPPAKPISGFSLIARVLWQQLVGLFTGRRQ